MDLQWCQLFPTLIYCTKKAIDAESLWEDEETKNVGLGQTSCQ